MGIKEIAHRIPLISRSKVCCNERGSLSSSLDEEHAKGFGARAVASNEIIMRQQFRHRIIKECNVP